jgi:dTDP-4-dehydrorhamnose 3,5-epimerase
MGLPVRDTDTTGADLAVIFTPLALDGAHLIRTEPAADTRGYFARSFCKTEFHAAGLETDFPQHSLSYNSEAGTLRGLHYQNPPFEEVKVVRCSRGSIHDVIVDLRRNSPTLGQWLALELSADNGLALYIPAGFAHGFITLAPASEVHYMISRDYAPGYGRVLRWDDPDLAIQWPLQPAIMSASDQHAPAWHEFLSKVS